MKKLLKLIGASSLLCMLFAIPSRAQIVESMNFTTTFPFYAGNAKLPAGTYVVKPSDIDNTILLIEDVGKKASAFVEFSPGQSDTPHKTTETTFKKYGTTEFLDQIWILGQKYTMTVLPTKVQQQLAKAGAAQSHSVAAKGK